MSKSKRNKSTEILIVRNAVFRRQYDVVEVDFKAEQVQVIRAGLDFEDAVALKEALRPDEVNGYCESNEYNDDAESLFN